MVKKKIIKIGNSAGIMLPKNIREEVGIRVGDGVMLEYESLSKVLIISKNGKKKTQSTLTPEFQSWLKKFNAKYKNALTELAKK